MLIVRVCPCFPIELTMGQPKAAWGTSPFRPMGKQSMTVLPVDLVKHALKPDLGLAVEILSIATANPPNKVNQRDALIGAAAIYPQFASVFGLFTNTGIDFRYTCKPNEWYQQPHTWEERTEVFQKHALELLEHVAIEATARAGLSLHEIDAFVTNTITGLAIPSSRCTSDELAGFFAECGAAADIRARLRRRRCGPRTRGALCSRSPGTERALHHRRSLQPLCTS